MNLAVVEIKAFVPARDLEMSKQFYLALGFEIRWEGEDLAYVRHGGTSFLLHAFCEPVHANNFQMPFARQSQVSSIASPATLPSPCRAIATLQCRESESAEIELDQQSRDRE